MFRALAAAALLLGALPALLLAGALVHGRFRGRPAPSRTAALTPAEHPRLWAEVDAVAAALEVEPPSRLVVDAQAGVVLHVAATRRELRIGLPVLAATTRIQLRALLAQELGYAGARSRSAVLADRTQEAAEVLGAAAGAALGDSRAGWLLRLVRPYVVLAERVTSASRLSAAAQAAQLVGSAATAAALRRAAELEQAWAVLHREYVPLALAADRRPALVHGLHRVLGARATAVEAAVDTDRALLRRLQVLLAVPVRVAAGPDDELAACTLLDGGFSRLELLESALSASTLAAAPWPEVAARAGLVRCAEQTATLVRSATRAGVPAPVTLRGVLDAVGRGLGARLQAQHLAAAVSHSLCLSGRFVHRIDWVGDDAAGTDTTRADDPQPWRLTSATDPEAVVDVAGLMGHVLADPAQVPELCRLLERHGAALDLDLDAAVADCAVPEGMATTLAGPDGRRYDLLVCRTGLLLLPARVPLRWRPVLHDRAARAERAEQRRVAALLAGGLPRLRALPGTRWIGAQEVSAARLHRRRGGWVLEVRVRLGLPVELRSTAQTRQHGTPLETAVAVLADRVGERAWQASALGVAVPA